MLSRLVAYVLVFLLLACTVAAVSAAVYDEPDPLIRTKGTEPVRETSAEVIPTEPQTAAPTDDKDAYTPRLTAPDYDNACYYSDDNIFYAADYGMPNCTCYAWGRAYEITGEKPELSPYDACTWYEYNEANGIYECGDVPEEGAIACWAYSDGGSGHVAVVEEVEENDIVLSNSAYNGTEFYTETVPVGDPSNGRGNWIFQGYIYIDR